MDSDSIIEEWTKRGIKIPLSDGRQSPQKLYSWGLFLLWRSLIKEKGIWWGAPMFHKENSEYNRS